MTPYSQLCEAVSRALAIIFSKSECGSEPCTSSPYIIDQAAAITMTPPQCAIRSGGMLEFVKACKQWSHRDV